MISYVYKAYDPVGNKRAGVVVVHTILDARRKLGERGLNPYFLEDLKVVKKAHRRRRKRRRILLAFGAILIAAALLFSGMYVGYAGREQAPTSQTLKEAGIVRGNSGTIVADTPQGREFANKISEAWQTIAPRVLSGVHVSKHLMTLYVERSVYKIPPTDLEVLVEHSVQQLQREFKSTGATLILIEGDLTMMQARYNPYTGSTKITKYD